MMGAFSAARLSLALAPLIFWAASVGIVSAERKAMAFSEAGNALVLEGVIVAASPADSVALVRRSGAPRARVLRIGQEIEGYLLVEITKTSARFQGRDGDLQLFLGGDRAEDDASLGPSAHPAEPAQMASPDDGWIRRIIPRASAKRRLSKEMPVILKETDVSPRIEDGEVTGIRVSRLPDGTLLSESGLLPGDVLVSINGEPLHGVDSLWALLARLLDKDELRVVVRRKGETLRLAYDFTN